MLPTQVKTVDGMKTAEYTTEDKLYGLHANDIGSSQRKIYAGQDNKLSIDLNHWKAFHWLRSPQPYSRADALFIDPGSKYIAGTYVSSRYRAVAAAFKLGLDNVLFAGNAAIPDTAEINTEFDALASSSSTNTFNLRIKGGTMGGTVTNNNGVLTYTANSDERLVVLAQSTAGGDTYSYVKDGTGTGH